MFAFLIQSSLPLRGRWLILPALFTIVIVLGALAACYWLNQHAVRRTLEPRRKELEDFLASLGDEPPTGGP